MENADVRIYRDEKPRLYATDWEGRNLLSFPQPAFYNSHEFKGAYFVKSYGAWSVGVLVSSRNIFTVYNLGNAIIQWAYKSEMRTKGVLQSVLCNDRLSHLYTRDSLHGLLLGNTMELAFSILSNEHPNQHFILYGNYTHFHYLTNDHRAERLLRLYARRQPAQQKCSCLQCKRKHEDPRLLPQPHSTGGKRPGREMGVSGHLRSQVGALRTYQQLPGKGPCGEGVHSGIPVERRFLVTSGRGVLK